MADQRCPHVNNCPLFAAFQVQSFLRIWQVNYCDAVYERCARYQLQLEGKDVPLTLLPNGKEIPDPGALKPR